MLSNSQLNKLKPAIKNKAEVFLRLSSNMIGNSDNKINFPHELVLTNTRGANIRKAFANNSSSKIQLSKMMQLRGFLGRLLGFITKNGIAINGKCNKTIS